MDTHEAKGAAPRERAAATQAKHPGNRQHNRSAAEKRGSELNEWEMGSLALSCLPQAAFQHVRRRHGQSRRQISAVELWRSTLGACVKDVQKEKQEPR